jgi:hypothetical protein
MRMVAHKLDHFIVLTKGFVADQTCSPDIVNKWIQRHPIEYLFFLSHPRLPIDAKLPAKYKKIDSQKYKEQYQAAEYAVPAYEQNHAYIRLVDPFVVLLGFQFMWQLKPSDDYDHDRDAATQENLHYESDNSRLTP